MDLPFYFKNFSFAKRIWRCKRLNESSQNIASDLEEKITDASISNASRKTIQFCDCDTWLKRNMQSALGLIPFTQ